MKFKKTFKIVTSILVCIILFLYYQNNNIEITKINIESEEIPSSFEGYKILQVSDLHNKKYRNNHKDLVDKTKELQPDIIVITGDLIDSRRTDVNVATNYIKQIKDIAPIYYVSGNHESRVDEYTMLKEQLIENGVTILDNKSEEITINNESITISGVDDIDFYENQNSNYEEEIKNDIKNLLSNSKTEFNILLSHRPELVDLYKGFDLVYSGHAHGGQFRLPFIGAVFAPDQGFNPEYTEGLYELEDSKMIVSRGLGNSIFPFRLFNQPELVLTRLNHIDN